MESSVIVSTDLDIPVCNYTRSETILKHTGYTVSYNVDWKLPNWVSYELTGIKTKGQSSRKNSFKIHPQLKGISATNEDYQKSGYDKGHMAPAADMKWNSTAMEESFYFSNICPQHPELNRKGWKELEAKVRDWAVRDSAIIVVCGPVVRKEPDYIGKNRITVPQAFFKVILSPYVNTPRAIGFLFENTEAKKPLSNYAVPVDSVESITGMDFFGSLPDEIENIVESVLDSCYWELCANKIET